MSFSCSVIVEWETGLECAPTRAGMMLRAVAEQIRTRQAETSEATETIICFDVNESTELAVRDSLGGALVGRDWPGVLRIISSPDKLDYYQKKNFGFQFAANDLIVFLDSDVVPEPGWLSSLTAAFDDERKSVVMGRTHLETGTRYERAIALSWIFDTRSDAAIHPVVQLTSNNIAFRRALFARLPFPDRPTHRGQCSVLGESIMRCGIRMYEEPAARAVHPAHDGLRAFVRRAAHAGEDTLFYDVEKNRAGVRRGIIHWSTDLKRVADRIAARRATVAAGILDIISAGLLGGAYYTIKLVSYLMQHRRNRKRFAIA